MCVVVRHTIGFYAIEHFLLPHTKANIKAICQKNGVGDVTVKQE